MFAVIRTGGKQYKVQQDTFLKVEKLDAEVGSKIDITDILMISDGDKTTVGAPIIEGAKVVAEVLEQGRGEKVIIFKKRRRQNYRRKNGHRQDLTTIKITEIKAA
ncbi:MAG: 50S ribosomal protein L21 [Alphaproteobacteria bacterium]|nr:50S ribosomal protein L21 [Alphaproteobacteria bacterium]MCB1551067.1 50S ribosomal protein L21 [Alphaproteobacteria bacterium]MCB9984803.1 50S ribosomal protein L21 [Micavibrio sp.]HPQ51532.1 50S ribosomal protein L21 [Alphaproteobacteria bacterium]HRK97194.1 50S ribosomal protein L21 [Alphaproteobacteria bacterium]